ncbi:hemoglobin subunit beta-1-like [Podarcis lilfordi]|uniref:Hemoglobin subunit beta-1-like n=1 Tax=Podarcis lilfordi TaxID=74358 RepID=A0AA35KAG6_9SAUR|nr:hemoglobin subunit beta-1-like [Podarcis lilfordi]
MGVETVLWGCLQMSSKAFILACLLGTGVALLHTLQDFSGENRHVLRKSRTFLDQIRNQVGFCKSGRRSVGAGYKRLQPWKKLQLSPEGFLQQPREAPSPQPAIMAEMQITTTILMGMDVAVISPEALARQVGQEPLQPSLHEVKEAFSELPELLCDNLHMDPVNLRLLGEVLITLLLAPPWTGIHPCLPPCLPQTRQGGGSCAGLPVPLRHPQEEAAASCWSPLPGPM